VVAALLAGVSLFMSYRMFRLISAHAVNVLYWDQWDFWDPIFEQRGPWALFEHQHGPHRQGLGLLLTGLVADVSGWNTLVESFVIGAIVVLAMLAAVALKCRVAGPLAWSDVAIPLIVLTTAQYATFVGIPNPAPAALPLLLLLLYALAWTLPTLATRYPAVLGLNVALTWTGYGVFAGVLTPVLLTLDGGQRLHWGWGASKGFPTRETPRCRGALLALGALAGSLASAAMFSVGYVWAPAADCLVFPHQRPWEYAAFVGLMFSRVLELGTGPGRFVALAVGLALLVLALWALIHHVRRLLRGEIGGPRSSLAVTILLGYSLLYAAFTAVGRVCFGLDAATSSRYVTLMIPAVLGLYLAALAVERRALRRAILVVTVAALVPVHVPGRVDAVRESAWYSEGKRRWSACYLELRDIAACDRKSGFRIYPRPDVTRLRQKLELLEARRLNLFLDH